MQNYSKYNRKTENTSFVGDRFVRTTSGQFANDCGIEVRLPAWMKSALIDKIGRKNISRHIRNLILEDFLERGISEPLTDSDKQRMILEMKDFK